MAVYRSKYPKLPGTSHDEVIKAARREHQLIQKRTPNRQPYVRSKYFNGDKVFVNIFFNHLAQKRKGEQMVRARFYANAIDLIRNTNVTPDTILSYKNPNELLHRFTGQSKEGDLYYVQVKHNKKSGRKDFMSVFPIKKTK